MVTPTPRKAAARTSKSPAKKGTSTFKKNPSSDADANKDGTAMALEGKEDSSDGEKGDDNIELDAPKKSTETPKKPTKSASAKASTAEKKIVRQPPCHRNARIKTRRSQVFHCLPPEPQKCPPETDENYKNYY